MSLLKTDICVIGAGAGGLSVAAGAVQMGAKVVLVEGGKMGGDCLNYGCVPSKSLIAAARQAHFMRSGAALGIQPVEPVIDFGQVRAHMRGVIDMIAPHDSVERFEGLGVRVIREFGRFTSGRELVAGEHRIRARRFVIATGSSPVVPPIEGLGSVPYLTNETIFELKELPEHLLIVGGGAIGMELAQAYRRLGSKVSVVEAARILHHDDPDCTAPVIDQIRSEGVALYQHVLADRVSSGNTLTLHLSDGTSLSGSHLLIAAGRMPNTSTLDLEKAGVALNNGAIKVDRGLRTSNRRIYAIGDVNGEVHFTHAAGYQAGVVIRSALLGLPARHRTDHIPRVTYTEPEIAHIGPSEAQARERYGSALEVVHFDFKDVDRAKSEAKTAGFIKLLVLKGRPIGVSAVGENAGEIINLWSLVVANRMKIGAVAAMVSPYPIFGEISKRAAGQYFAPRLFENPWIMRAVGFVQRLP